MLFPQDAFLMNRIFMVEPDFELYHYKTDTPLNVDMHHHDFYEIYLFLSGNVNYIIDGRQYHLKPNDILLINSHELHKPVITPGITYERIVFFIRPEFIRARSTDGINLASCFEPHHLKSHRNLLRASPKILSLIKDTIVRIKSLSNDNSLGNSLLKDAYLTEFLVYINKSYLEELGEHMEIDITFNETIDKLINYIIENLDEDLSLERLSAKFFISKYYLAHKFKRSTSFTLHSFIQYKRMLKARTLLQSGQSVISVCMESGFCDYSNFIRAFRKMFGISPKKYTSQYMASVPHNFRQ